MSERLECSDLLVGATFDAPVFFDDGVNMFLAPGHPAKQYHLDVLERWHIPFLITSGHRVDAGYVENYGTLEELEPLETLETVDDAEDLVEEPQEEEMLQPVDSDIPMRPAVAVHFSETDRMDRLAEKLMSIEPVDMDKSEGRAEIEDILSHIEFEEEPPFLPPEDSAGLEDLQDLEDLEEL